MQSKQTGARLVVAGLVSACLFGAATPASKALLGGVKPQALAGLLYLGAAIGVLPIVLKEKALRWPWHAPRRTLLLLLGAITLGGVCGPLFLLLGLRVASSGSVSLWLNLEVVATVLLGHLVFRDHLRARGWLAAGGTVVAAALLAGSEADTGVLAVLLVASGCVCWGFDNHFTALIDGITPAQVTLWKGIIAGAFNLAVGGMIAGGVGSVPGALVALLVGAVSYGLSIMLYITAAQGLGASRSQMVFSAAPFFGFLISVTVLGESPTPIQVLAGGLIAGSLILMLRERHAHVHWHDVVSHQHLHRHDDGHHDHVHEEMSPQGMHVHWHEHQPREHEHVHWPDLHHRHRHENGKGRDPSDARVMRTTAVSRLLQGNIRATLLPLTHTVRSHKRQGELGGQCH
ncbi:MAG: DMT family transporter [bacterium]